MSRTIAVDIGGTHARFATRRDCRAAGRRAWRARHAQDRRPWQHARPHGRSSNACPAAVFRARLGLPFAGPVDGNILKLTNNPWIIRKALMKDKLGVEHFTYRQRFRGDRPCRRLSGQRRLHPSLRPRSPVRRRRRADHCRARHRPWRGAGPAPLWHAMRSSPPKAGISTLRRSIRSRTRSWRSCADLSAAFRSSAWRAGLDWPTSTTRIAAIEHQAVQQVDDKALWAAALDGADPIAACGAGPLLPDPRRGRWGLCPCPRRRRSRPCRRLGLSPPRSVCVVGFRRPVRRQGQISSAAWKRSRSSSSPIRSLASMAPPPPSPRTMDDDRRDHADGASHSGSGD